MCVYLTGIAEPLCVPDVVGGVEEEGVGRVHLQVLVRVVLGPLLPAQQTVYTCTVDTHSHDPSVVFSVVLVASSIFP